ncbi:MAG TPA: nucleotide pyrophosphohydrolase [Candidatus Saccharimonadales bacterium]|nr:nucleotide pyrophosphohydrolase [Candidatus Saccharimonadales bacterium]
MSKKRTYSLEELTDFVIAFRDRRDWKQFHNPKDCAIALNLEASEVLEPFRWKNKSEVRQYVQEHKEEIANELSDVLYWVLLMSHDLHIDLGEAFYKKRQEDDLKYPVEKVKGKHKKYNEY